MCFEIFRVEVLVRGGVEEVGVVRRGIRGF